MLSIHNFEINVFIKSKIFFVFQTVQNLKNKNNFLKYAKNGKKHSFISILCVYNTHTTVNFLPTSSVRLKFNSNDIKEQSNAEVILCVDNGG